MYRRIEDLPEDMRPQEKLVKHGPEVLSNAELIALIIRVGSKKKSSISIAQDLINLGCSSHKEENKKEFYGLKFLASSTIEDLIQVDGIGVSKASMILAAVELGRRTYRDKNFVKEKITDTTILPNIVMDEMRFLGEEHFKIAILNTKKELEYIENISIGSINQTVVEPREVFQKAIKRNAHTIILLHNHPSGNPRPSPQDLQLTRRLVEAGDIMGISVIDHIIIGDGNYYSFLEEGYI